MPSKNSKEVKLLQKQLAAEVAAHAAEVAAHADEVAAHDKTRQELARLKEVRRFGPVVH